MPLIPRVLLNKEVARYATAYWLKDILKGSHRLNQVCLLATREWDSDSRGLYNLHQESLWKVAIIRKQNKRFPFIDSNVLTVVKMPSIKKYCLGIRDSLESSWELKKFILQSSKNFSKMVRFMLGLVKKIWW